MGFRVDQSPLSEKYMIYFGDDIYEYFKPSDFCGLYPARVLGLEFPDYLRMARDEYNATIYGKKGYPYIQFDSKEDAQKLCKLLNLYWAKAKKIL